MSKSRKGQIESIVENAVLVDKLNYSIPHEGYYYRILIDRPNVLVKLYNSCFLHAPWLGWAKANWPDKWDAKFGIKVALGKAAASMIKS